MSSQNEEQIAAARGQLQSARAAAQIAALVWLSANAPAALLPEDLPLLAAPTLPVRVAALLAFRAAADPTLVHAARRELRLLIEGTDAERYAGLRAAAQIANPTLAPRLLASLAHPDPETRRLTLLALVAVPAGFLGPAFMENVFGTALADPDPAVRDLAAALQRGDGADC